MGWIYWNHRRHHGKTRRPWFLIPRRDRRHAPCLAVRQQPGQPLLYLAPLLALGVEPGAQIANRFLPLGQQQP
ncbi:MAG: hypothetical protein J2P48_01560 [Alphaproteobacteria bacterium]|nr:hypothetical protein [Alphaproteobacteria bacterium]